MPSILNSTARKQFGFFAWPAHDRDVHLTLAAPPNCDVA
jgi:hypothetical protein